MKFDLGLQWCSKLPICHGNAKMKKTKATVASKIPKDKTHVLKNAAFLNIFKFLFGFSFFPTRYKNLH